MILSCKRFGPIAWLLIPALLSYLTQDFSYALSPLPADLKQSNVARGTGFDDLLIELKNALQPAIGATTQQDASGKTSIDLARVRGIRANLVKMDHQIHAYFAEQKEFLLRRGLSGDIVRRHEQMVQDYEANWKSLSAYLDRIDPPVTSPAKLLARVLGSVPDGQAKAAGDLDSFLKQRVERRRAPRLDPKNLPHRALKSTQPILPKMTQQEWLKAFPQEVGKNKNSSAGEPALLSTGSSTAASQNAPMVLSSPAPADSGDLAETIEVKLTPEIRQQAADLGKNPVKIYNWVRNNIDFVPTWGSIQGAQMCLETRVCNAFDTSSLLIALLRASDIPARYQMGTIEVPVEAFKNWAGGFTDADAAASFFASAGVPSVVRRVDGTGQVASVKLEHVWVKAFVDYAPSGGAVNRGGDTWVDLDPSFKQFTYTSRSDFTSTFPRDPVALANEVLADASIDGSVGSLMGQNPAPLLSAMQASASQIEQLQNSLPADEAVRQLFGAKAIRAVNLPVLPAAMPCRILASAEPFQSIPAQLRHSLKITVEDAFGNQSLTLNLALPVAGGRRLALNYIAATDADADALLEQWQASAGNSILPGNVMVRPVVRLDDQTVASGSPIILGYAQVFRISFQAPTITTSDIINPIAAGEQFAIGLDLGQISPARMAAEAQHHQEIVNLIDAGNFQTLNDMAENRVGERVLNTLISTWFSFNAMLSRAAAALSDGITVRYPSAGLCFMDLTPITLFGVTISVRHTGVSLDIDRDIVITEMKNGDRASAMRLSLIQGHFGAQLESSLPNRFFSPAPQQPRWASATSIMNLAAEQGIPLLGVNQLNQQAAFAALSLPQELKDEIADAVNAGLTVITPQQEVTQLQFKGVGYIVEDPRTGAAAYLISGGLDGGTLIGGLSEDGLEDFLFNGTGQWAMSILTSLGPKFINLGLNIIGFLHDIETIIKCFAGRIGTGGTGLDQILRVLGVMLISLAALAVMCWMTASSPFLSIAIGGVVVLSEAMGALMLDVLGSALISATAVFAIGEVTGCH